MKNMKNKILLLWISASFVFMIGCTESFFELSPNDKLSTANLYKTANDFDLAIMACYSKLQGQNDYYYEMCEFRSDNIFLDAPTGGAQDRYDIDHFADNSSNGILLDLWANFNNGVLRCNLVLDKIDGAGFNATLRSQYKGEALFIRAHTYFNMYRAWGGVPVTNKPVTVTESLEIGRSTDEQMYNFIVGDLKAIVDGNLLPESYSGSDVGRITSGAAKALLGKVYLTFNKWAEARDVLVGLTTSNYGLLTNIGDVFDVNNENNKEIIFAISFSKTVVGEGHGYSYSVSNLTENNHQSDALKNCFADGDERKDMLTFVKVEIESAVFVMKKFYDEADPLTQDVGNDRIVLRYADVLLMYAEALNEIGYSGAQDSPALMALNEVHERAGLDPLQIATLPNQDAFRKAILHERQCEFPYEGHRWFDLVRMGGAIEAVKADSGKDIHEWQLLYPIPKEAIERINNTALLWQNYGY